MFSPLCPNCGAAHDTSGTICPTGGAAHDSSVAIGPAGGAGHDSSEATCPTDGAALLSADASAPAPRPGDAPAPSPAPSGDPPLIGQLLDGRYELREVLGEGGMGRVYLAHQSSMDRDVAVKVLHPWFAAQMGPQARFLREARACSRLQSPNTVRVFDFGQTAGGVLYMVQELLDGRSLQTELEQGGAMDWRRASRICQQVCVALTEAHAAGIVHRDLKPENIFLERHLEEDDFVRVLDFGIALVGAEARTTRAGALLGTPTYMSPEQARGAPDLDARSDLYALGTILYEMLTGEVVYTATVPLGVVLKHIHEPPPELPPAIAAQLPPVLSQLLDRLLAKRREDRPEDCRAVRQILAEALAVRPASRPRAAAAERRPRRTDLELRDTVSGQRFDLLAATPAWGVLMATGEAPPAGKRFTLFGAQRPLRTAQASVESLGAEPTVVAPGCVRVQWLRVIAPDMGTLSGALTALLGEVPIATRSLAPDGESWVAYVPRTGELLHVAAPDAPRVTPFR